MPLLQINSSASTLKTSFKSCAVTISDHIAVIKEGYLVTEGKPQEIVTAQLLKDVFKVEADDKYPNK